MKAKALLLILFSLLYCLILAAKDPNQEYSETDRAIDSLQTVIASSKHDTLVCEAYMVWGEKVSLTHPDSALTLWQLAYNLAEKNLKADLPLELKEKYVSLLAGAMNNIGRSYEQLGDIEKALEYLHKSLILEEEIGNISGIATSLNNIGLIFSAQGEYEKALEYIMRSLEIQKEIGNMPDAAGSLNNIGFIYNNQGKYKKAIFYLKKSLGVCKQIKLMYGISHNLNNIGFSYHSLGDYDKALEYYKRSLKIDEEMGNQRGKAGALNNIAGIYLEQGNILKAESLAKTSLEMAQELRFPAMIRNAAKQLVQVYKKTGSHRDALEMYELHIKMRDSLSNEQTHKATIRQQTKYEFEKAQLVKAQNARDVIRLAEEANSRRDNLQYSIVLICLLALGVLITMLGRLSLSVRAAEGLIFFSFLIFFEFLLVLADPYIDTWSGGAPGIKLLFNAGIAAMVFPLHAFFEDWIKSRLSK